MATFKHDSGDTTTVADDSRAAARLARLPAWSRVDAPAAAEGATPDDASKSEGQSTEAPTSPPATSDTGRRRTPSTPPAPGS